MNERPTKTFYIAIDSDDGLPTPCATADGAWALSQEHNAKYPSYFRTPFRIDITGDENGKPHFKFTELEEPRVEYWIKIHDADTMLYEAAGWVGGSTIKHRATRGDIRLVYIKADQGNLILLNDDEKAKVIEEWKNS